MIQKLLSSFLLIQRRQRVKSCNFPKQKISIRDILWLCCFISSPWNSSKDRKIEANYRLEPLMWSRERSGWHYATTSAVRGDKPIQGNKELTISGCIVFFSKGSFMRSQSSATKSWSLSKSSKNNFWWQHDCWVDKVMERWQ